MWEEFIEIGKKVAPVACGFGVGFIVGRVTAPEPAKQAEPLQLENLSEKEFKKMWKAAKRRKLSPDEA